MSASYISASLRREVARRAGNRCEYCLLAEEDSFFMHEPDHIIAKKHGGETSLGNLANACFNCNRFKGSDIASLDPSTQDLVSLYSPRVALWPDHFVFETGIIHPRTPTARVTVRLLKMNFPERVEVRKMLSKAGRYPG